MQQLVNNLQRRHELYFVSDGIEALDFLHCRGAFGHAPPPNLILLDMNVPKGDSVEILEEIRTSDDISEVPVAILSSADAPHPKDRAALAKATCYLTKPPNLDEFLSLGKQIRSLVERGMPLD